MLTAHSLVCLCACGTADWQNGVYLLFIVLCIMSAKVIFKWSLEFSHAKSHGVGHGDSFKFALAGKDVTGTKAGGPAQAGYGDDASSAVRPSLGGRQVAACEERSCSRCSRCRSHFRWRPAESCAGSA